MNLPKEEDVRKAVRLVVPSLKNIVRADGITSLKNAPIPDQIFILRSLFQYWVYAHGY